MFKSYQIITVSVLLEGEEEEFLCSFVYAENIAEKRKRVMEGYQDSSGFWNVQKQGVGDYERF